MKYSLALLPFLASAAFAQEDLWKALQIGDRVQITFRSGNTLTGQLEARLGDPKVKISTIDYVQATEITINLTYEYPGLEGNMTIPKKEIKSIRKLQALDPTTRKRLEEERDRIKKSLAADEAERKAAEERRTEDNRSAAEAALKTEGARAEGALKGADEAAKAEKMKKAMEVLNKFPPPQWGPHIIQEIANKATRKQPVSAAEREFADNFGLWQEAVLALQAKENEKKEKKPEEKKQ